MKKWLISSLLTQHSSGIQVCPMEALDSNQSVTSFSTADNKLVSYWFSYTHTKPKHDLFKVGVSSLNPKKIYEEALKIVLVGSS